MVLGGLPVWGAPVGVVGCASGTCLSLIYSEFWKANEGGGGCL
jgi:hypothetical protein